MSFSQQDFEADIVKNPYITDGTLRGLIFALGHIAIGSLEPKLFHSRGYECNH